MRKHYDFSGAVKNPHAGKFKNGYTIVVSHKDYDEVITVKKEKMKKGDNSTKIDTAISAPASNIQ